MTDLVTNTLGGCVGYFLYWVLAKIVPKKILDVLVLILGTLAVSGFILFMGILFTNHVQLNYF